MIWTTLHERRDIRRLRASDVAITPHPTLIPILSPKPPSPSPRSRSRSNGQASKTRNLSPRTKAQMLGPSRQYRSVINADIRPVDPRWCVPTWPTVVPAESGSVIDVFFTGEFIPFHIRCFFFLIEPRDVMSDIPRLRLTNTARVSCARRVRTRATVRAVRGAGAKNSCRCGLGDLQRRYSKPR